MSSPTFLLFLLLLLLITLTTINSIDLRPKCGFPGKPYRAKISPEEKQVYDDGEVVSYQCTDYWAAPQERKCVQGRWTGPMARCGDFIKDLLMKDSKTIDMSARPRPQIMWHHTDMNITNTNWKYPNAFTSNRFKKARLRIDDDHEYRWYFNFTKPMVKLYVKVNFNFMNFTLLPEEVKKAHRWEVEVEISPHRTCRFDYKDASLWRDSGIRMDTYFICEGHSFEALRAEAADPPNYMVMRTRSSHNISHEFVALFFGRAYGGNGSEIICGEPEIDYGQSFRANVEYQDYIIDCANKEDWRNVAVDASFSYSIKCIGDMVWYSNRTAPQCIPTKICSLGGVAERMLIQDEGEKVNQTSAEPTINLATSGGRGAPPITSTSSHSMLIIEAINQYYHFLANDTIYATPGTELTYNCLDQESYILAGKDFRKCRPDGTWSGNEPTCRFLESNNKLIESSNSLMVAIIIMGILLIIIIAVSCVLFVLYTRRLRQKKAELEAGKAEVSAWQNEMNLYDNITELGGSRKRLGEDGIYEVYEHIDEYTTPGNEYTVYNDANYSSSTYAVMSDGGVGQLYGNVPTGPQYTELDNGSDYVKMLRDSRMYQHLVPPMVAGSLKGPSNPGRVVIMRSGSEKRRDETEPSYLEISK